MVKRDTSVSQSDYSAMVRRLDALIAVILSTTGKSKPLSTREKIQTLTHSELTPLEMARILGIPNKTIRARLVEIRREARPSAKG